MAADRKNQLTPVARRLRKQATEPERLLWRHLRSRRIGLKFCRQVPLGGYVVDFACFEKRVVIELDGSQHATDEGRTADADRDAALAEAGFRVLRFWNHQVYEDVETVCEQIYAACMNAPSIDDSPSPYPTGGEGTLAESS